MPQNKELTMLPLRLPEPGPDLPPAFAQYMREYNAAFQRHFNAMACTNIRSGLTKYDDEQNEGYFLGFARNVSGVPDGTPVFALRGSNARISIEGENTSFFVGDRGAEKYFEFDGADLNIGFNTKFLGVDAVNNDKLFRHMPLESSDGIAQTTSGSTNITFFTAGGGVRINTGITASSAGELEKSLPLSPPLTPISWSGDLTLSYRLSFETVDSNLSFFVGAGRRTDKRIGFSNSGATLLGVVNDGADTTTVNLGSIAESDYVLRADKANDEVNFFVNGVLAGTISSDLPTGAMHNALEKMFILYVANSSGSVQSVVASDAYFVQR